MIAPIRILTLFPSTAWRDPCPFSFSGPPLTRDGQDSKTLVGIEVGRIQDDEDGSANTFRVHFHILWISACFGFSDFSDLLHFPDFRMFSHFRISTFFALSHFCLGYAHLSFFVFIQMHSTFGLWHVDSGLQEDSIWRLPHFPCIPSCHFCRFRLFRRAGYRFASCPSAFCAITMSYTSTPLPHPVLPFPDLPSSSFHPYYWLVAFHAPHHVTDWGQSVSKVCTRCGMCIIPGQVNPYFPAICGWSLCVPYAFLHFRSSGVCIRAQEIRKSTAGNSRNRRTTFGHHSYPSHTSHVISGSLLVRICLVLSTAYLFRHYSTCFSLRNRIT